MHRPLHHDHGLWHDWYVRHEETLLGLALLALALLALLTLLQSAPGQLPTPKPHGLSGQELLEYLRP